MTANPECTSVDSSIVEALHSMHEGKYMHLLVVDKGRHPLLVLIKAYTSTFFDVSLDNCRNCSI